VEEALKELLEQESKAREKYADLMASAGGATARELIATILAQKKFEIETLKLLASGKVPDQFMGFGTVTEDEVNFRDAPTPQAAVLMTLFRGMPVILTEKRGNWVGLQLYDGKAGWVFKDYVRAAS
jgi:SH3-like domain-containing protein